MIQYIWVKGNAALIKLQHNKTSQIERKRRVRRDKIRSVFLSNKSAEMKMSCQFNLIAHNTSISAVSVFRNNAILVTQSLIFSQDWA